MIINKRSLRLTKTRKFKRAPSAEKKRLLAELSQGERVKRSGLWDESANKGKLVIYRVGEAPPSSP